MSDQSTVVSAKRFRLNWLEVAMLVVALVVFAGVFMLLVGPRMNEIMNPPPSRIHLEEFQAALDADGIPIKADVLVALEIDRPSFIGEGQISRSWDEWVKSVGGVPVPGEPSCVLVKTRKDDFAKIMKLGENRVRIVAGHSLEEWEAHKLFDEELLTGRGRHPAYNIEAFKED